MKNYNCPKCNKLVTENPAIQLLICPKCNTPFSNSEHDDIFNNYLNFQQNQQLPPEPEPVFEEAYEKKPALITRLFKWLFRSLLAILGKLTSFSVGIALIVFTVPFFLQYGVLRILRPLITFFTELPLLSSLYGTLLPLSHELYIQIIAGAIAGLGITLIKNR